MHIGLQYHLGETYDILRDSVYHFAQNRNSAACQRN